MIKVRNILLIASLVGSQCVATVNAELTAKQKEQLASTVLDMRKTTYAAAKTHWDTGTNGGLIEGNSTYKKGLLEIAVLLENKCYPKGHFGDGGIEALLLNRWASTADMYGRINDTYGDGGGFMNSVGAGDDANNMLVNVVQTIVERTLLHSPKARETWIREWQSAAKQKGG